MSLEMLCFELRTRTSQEEHVSYAKKRKRKEKTAVKPGLKVCRALVRGNLGLFGR